MKKSLLVTIVLALLTTSSVISAPKLIGNDYIKLNQVGYYPSQEKIVVVESGQVSSISVIDANGKTVMKARRKALTVSPISKKKRSTFDLSGLTVPGLYYVVANKQRVPLTVSEKALSSIADASIKSFYYQRTAMPIEAEYAGKWTRPAGHPDTHVLVHPAAASIQRPAGTVICSPKGWYDAGDYNKYVVNSAFAMGLMLSMYEIIPQHFDAHRVNIPESNNSTADILDENMWNLEWLFTMQDYDGGAYHKLTTPNFEGFIKPTECKQQRYVTQKTTCATLDLAAIMAKCARIYKGNKDYADVSIRCINSARAAYEWAKKNPEVFYRQDSLNVIYAPKVNTGAYGDGNANDEFFWAATELYLATGDKTYLDDAMEYAPDHFSTPSWAGVSALASFALSAQENLPAEAKALQKQQDSLLLAYAKKVTDINITKTSFYSPYGNSRRDFYWGCNSDGCGVQGVSLLFAYKISGDKEYLRNAFRDADYMLGRNATGYCYVTGFGQKPSAHPHHSLSETDDIEEPLPGFLVGGPNPEKQDGCEFPSDYADECYADVMQSYASNEIAINWSATLVALMNGLIALK